MSAAVSEANSLTRQLWHIAGNGDLGQLDELVSQGADVNAGDRTGVTALMRAAYHGQLPMVRALIEHGADPNAKDRSGLTALMMAEHGGHDEIVEALESFGAPGKTEVARKRGTSVSPVNHAQDARATFTLNQSVTEENVDAATEHDDWECGQESVAAATEHDDSESAKSSHTARTLHEPLEIWEMVHTTQTEPYSPSASPRRVFPTRILALAVGVLIICSGAVFGFLALRGSMNATGDTPNQQPEATALQRTSSSNQRLSASKSVTKGVGNAQSSNDQAQLKGVEKLMGERVDPPAVASSASSAKKSSSQRPRATKVSTAVSNKNVSRATKLESAQDTSSKPAKKEPAPPSDPVKPTIKQKPKVIEWP